MPDRDAVSAAPRGAPTPGWAVALVDWISRRRRLILAATFLLTVGASLSLLRLRLDVDLISMLPQGKQRFTDYRTYVQHFGAQDLAVALVHAPDASTATRFAEAFAAALRARPEIVEVRSRIDLAAFADALAKGALPRLLPLDAYSELERRLTPDAIGDSLRTLRRTLTTPGTVGLSAQIERDPLGLSRLLADALARERPDRALDPGSEYLLSPDGKRLLVLIRPKSLGGYGSQGVEGLEAALAAAEAQARAASATGDEVQVTYTGAFAYGRDDAALLRADMALYNTLALLGVLTVFHLGYRNLRILPFVIAQLVATTLITFALGLLVYGHLNAVSLAFAAIFFGLSIDTAIYFYTRFLEEWDGGERLEPALAAAVGALVIPAAVASGTTAAVFAVIGFSALTGVAQLGSITALGILLNLPATFVLLPALMLSLGGRGRLGRRRALRPTLRLAAIAAFAARRKRSVGLAALLLLAACAFLVRRTALDTDLFHLRPAHSPAADVQQEIRDAFGMSDPDGVVVVEADDGPAVSPEEAQRRDDQVLQASERVRDWLVQARDAGLVREVVSPAAFLPSRATQEARLRAWAALPREPAARALERDLAAQGFAVERFGEALEGLRRVPPPVDATRAALPGLELLLDRHLRRAPESTGVVTQFAPSDPGELEQIAERLSAEVRVPEGLHLLVTGRPLMELELRRTMRGEIAWFLLLAVVSNGLIIAFRERSARRTAALLCVPSGVVVVLLGVAGLAGLALNPVNLIVLPLTIGIGVDYCVYLAERVRETGSVREATALSGRGLAMTAGTTIIGFGVLGLSRYPALSGLGTLAALAMALSFAGAIAVLPAVLPPLASPRVRRSHSVEVTS